MNRFLLDLDLDAIKKPDLQLTSVVGAIIAWLETIYKNV